MIYAPNKRKININTDFNMSVKMHFINVMCRFKCNAVDVYWLHEIQKPQAHSKPVFLPTKNLLIVFTNCAY